MANDNPNAHAHAHGNDENAPLTHTVNELEAIDPSPLHAYTPGEFAEHVMCLQHNDQGKSSLCNIMSPAVLTVPKSDTLTLSGLCA